MERKNSSSQIENNKKYYLMSSIYPMGVDDEGNFDWAPGVWLTYHEAYRREIARLLRALDRFDPVQDAWKAIVLYRWLSEFFIPIVGHYEMGKRLFTIPYYTSKGYKIPDNLNYNENFLQEYYVTIPAHAKEILDMAMSDNLFPKKIKENVIVFKREIRELSKVLSAHYDAEERFWPAVFEKEGLEVWQKVLYRMLVYNRKVNPKTSNHIFAMVFHAIGYNLKYLSAEDPLDTPWCGSKTRYVFVKRSPFIVKALPLVKWMQDYLKYKAMINAVFFQSEDDQDFERRYRLFLQKQLRQQVKQEKWSQWMFNIFGHQSNYAQNQTFNSRNNTTAATGMNNTNNDNSTVNQDVVYSFAMMDDNFSTCSNNTHHFHINKGKNNSRSNSDSHMIAFTSEFKQISSEASLFLEAEDTTNNTKNVNNNKNNATIANNSSSNLTNGEQKKRRSSMWFLLFFRRNSQWSSSNLSTVSTHSTDNNNINNRNQNHNHNATNSDTNNSNNTNYNEKIAEETVENHALWVMKKQPSNSITNKSNSSYNNCNNKILPVN